MPNLFLEPIAETRRGRQPDRPGDRSGGRHRRIFAVGADRLAADNAPAGPELTAEEERALEDLTAVWLSASFPKRLAETYAHEGIPDRLAGTR